MKRLNRTRLYCALLAIFLASAIFNYLMWAHFQTSMGSDNAARIRKEIVEAHGVLIGILVGALAARPKGRQEIRPGLAIVSIVISGLWVLYIGSTWVGYPEGIGANGPDGLIDQFNDRALQLSTLVSGTLAYLSNKHANS